ncbi:isochorismatase family protein [Salinactinospora qingdaonensis]|uniref:Phenazine biosynthesis protein PhzD n=1 Tax=Salinactinospora qingdaonensis TaxID=702744 RepID=A0ABP7F1P7_9ACTN
MTGIPEIVPHPMPTAEGLPGNIATWKADPRRAVLLIHDMQRYFLRPFPVARSPLTELTHNSVRLRDRCAQLGIPVAYTAQPGAMSSAERGLLKDFWGPGMTASTHDRQIIEPLAPAAEDWNLTKWRYSAFFRTGLLERMREAGRDQLLVCGVYAHVGILATALDAYTNDIQPFLAADAIADFTPEYHRMAIEYTAQRCAVVATTDELLAQVCAAKGSAA